MDASPFARIAAPHPSASTRRAAVKRLSAAALGAVAIARLGDADARKRHMREIIIDDCIDWCLEHDGKHCHRRCRRWR
ncbi:MAG TPA: hypothetical protein VFX03_11120 [Thermomicrobiales bacterium]|nr:hypothetical protein [Thermomicrobiales bacterium]